MEKEKEIVGKTCPTTHISFINLILLIDINETKYTKL